ncbi:MAG: hypothetical protein M1457_06375 [bacterium]|nr:hypothetical protein [bacterium]
MTDDIPGSSVSRPAADPARPADPYAIVPELALAYPGAELILLPDRYPVALQARVGSTGAPAGDWRETGRSLQWQTDAGAIFAGTDPDTGAPVSYFIPPEGSRMATLTATLEVRLARGDQSRVERRTAMFRLLAPVDSKAMAGGVLDGFNLGHYIDPADPADTARYNIKSDWYCKYPDKYRVPAFFYRVTPETCDLKIAAHQTLGMHMIDFEWHSLGKTQYIALDLHLVRKLEELLALMQGDGLRATRLVPIYGFRPPSFNLGTLAEPGNLKEPFSMHQYGRAIDLIVDEDGDHVIDDLNGDGVGDIHDAAVIMHYVNILDRRYRAEGRMDMLGGAGLYTHNDFTQREHYLRAKGLKSQTAYIHVDTRGFLQDDGTLVRWPDCWPDGQPIRWSKI